MLLNTAAQEYLKYYRKRLPRNMQSITELCYARKAEVLLNTDAQEHPSQPE